MSRNRHAGATQMPRGVRPGTACAAPSTSPSRGPHCRQSARAPALRPRPPRGLRAAASAADRRTSDSRRRSGRGRRRYGAGGRIPSPRVAPGRCGSWQPTARSSRGGPAPARRSARPSRYARAPGFPGCAANVRSALGRQWSWIRTLSTGASDPLYQAPALGRASRGGAGRPATGRRGLRARALRSGRGRRCRLDPAGPAGSRGRGSRHRRW